MLFRSYFYATDKSGNSTNTVSITLDKTKPTGVLYAGSSSVSSGTATNAAYIKFVPFDAIGLASVYVKKPGSSSYENYTSGTQFTTELRPSPRKRNAKRRNGCLRRLYK